MRLITSGSEVRSDIDDNGNEVKKIVGYAVKWGQRSVPLGWFKKFKEEFQRGAFEEHLNSFDDQYASWNHNEDLIIGRRSARTLKLYEDDIGLRYEITPPSWASGHVESVERGDVKGSSFIFNVQSQGELWDEDSEDLPIRKVVKARIFEVAPVINPAYPTSEANARSELRNTMQIYRNYEEENKTEEISYELEKMKLDLLEKM